MTQRLSVLRLCGFTTAAIRAHERHSGQRAMCGESCCWFCDPSAALTRRQTGRPAAEPRGLLCRGGGSGVAEGRDHLLGETVEVGELDVERGAERGCADDAVEAGVALLDRF